MKILPSIDLLDGRVVRLTQGRFDRVTMYADDAREVARDYVAAGATHLHVVDLDGTRDGALRQTDAVRALLDVGLAVQVGGGVRSLDDARAYLDAGAEAVVVGSLAVREPELCETLLRELGPECVRLALDCRLDAAGVPRALTQGWAVEDSASILDLLERYRDAGLRTFLSTDVERDGTLEGPNLELYARLVERFGDLEVVASGGVGSHADLEALRGVGVDGAILGRALFEGTVDLERALAQERAAC